MTCDVPMIDLVVCPHCNELSRIEVGNLGTIVDCPHCDTSFTARLHVESEPTPIFVRARELDTGERFIPTVHPPELRTPTETGFTPAIVALLVLPWAIPLLWLLGPMIMGKAPVFSFAAPVALAICISGLGVGIGTAHGWSIGTRVRAMLALLMLGGFLGGFLFFLKKEWAEAIRRHVGPTQLQWQEFQPSDRTYSVNIPGRAIRRNDDPLLGWDMEAYRVERTTKRTEKAFEVIYDLAHGRTPMEFKQAKPTEEEWFAHIRKAILKKNGGELTAETTIDRAVNPLIPVTGRQYTIALADGTTNRIVQVYHFRDRAFLLAVEGAFIPSDADYVRRFFDSFKLDN